MEWIQWKMSYKPALSKQAQEIFFFFFFKKPKYAVLISNNILANRTAYQKHLGMFLEV